MKINVYEDLVNLLSGINPFKLSLNKDIDYESIMIYTDKHAFVEQKYLYILYKDGKDCLYRYPSLEYLYGDERFNKKQIRSVTDLTTYNNNNVNRDYRYSDHFRNTYYYYSNNEKSSKHDEYFDDVFTYLSNLYYKPELEPPAKYYELINKLKNECEKNNIEYLDNPKEIVKKYIELIDSKEDMFKTDVSMCTSLDDIDNYILNKLSKNHDESTFNFLSTNMGYKKFEYNMNFPGEFLDKTYTLRYALKDKKYPNRDQVLRNYLEFLIASKDIFTISSYLDQIPDFLWNKKMEMKMKRLKGNSEFMSQLEEIMNHDTSESTYLFHATTGEIEAKNILENGFYMYSSDTSSTTYAEFTKDGVLGYEYGGLVNTFGDYILIIDEPKDVEIVHKISDEEKATVSISPRRNGIVYPPDYKIDSSHIIGYIDKEHEKIVKNPYYKKQEKIM